MLLGAAGGIEAEQEQSAELLDSGDLGEFLAARVEDGDGRLAACERFAKEQWEAFAAVGSAGILAGGTAEQCAIADVTTGFAGDADRAAIDGVAGAVSDTDEELCEAVGEYLWGIAEDSEYREFLWAAAWGEEWRFVGSAGGLEAAVHRHELIDKMNDGRSGAIVFAEEDLLRRCTERLSVAFVEIAEEFDGGTTEAIETLVVVADNSERCSSGSRELKVDLFLKQIGVLVFVDEDSAKRLDGGGQGGRLDDFQEVFFECGKVNQGALSE